jgi:hypothetical protein
MSPLALTNQQFSALIRAAEPLQHCDRDPFLRPVARYFSGRTTPIGDGEFFRALRHLQREFWRPPAVAQAGPRYDNRSTKLKDGAPIAE